MVAGSGLFVTLTYSDLWLPADGKLKPEHLRYYIKHLRRSIGEEKFRYFAVGEYGEKSPFSLPPLCIFPSIDQEKIVSCWKFGLVHIGLVEPKSIGYITHYTTKGLTTGKSERREFARMSLKPGIGAGLVDSIPLTKNGVAMVDVLSGGDVPSGVVLDGRLLPYGRYLKQRLRSRLGRGKKAPEESSMVKAREYSEGSKSESEMLRRKAERSLHADSAAAKQAIKRLKRTI
ncbi:replication associated protein [Microviridae sp.]|nr:replication associated protein [Microviridae sp.]